MSAHPEQPPPSSDPRAALLALRSTCRSAMLATVDINGGPDASYAPFSESAGRDGALLVLVSRLARHTANLLHTGRVSVMLIEDEGNAGQIFGRRRATYSCRVERIVHETRAWSEGVEAMQQRHGDVVSMLRNLKDFELLRLVPERGTLVLGFGRAWRLGGTGCRELQPIGPGATSS